MRMWSQIPGLSSSAAALWLVSAPHGLAGQTVMVSLQPVLSLSEALGKGTDLEVRGVSTSSAGMNRLSRSLARADAALESELRSATATISIESVWPEDPLYREARARNIRVVPIDAARSLDKAGASVAVIRQPSGSPLGPTVEAPGSISPYIWLSPSNMIKMADIVAADLMRLAPADGETIRTNRSEIVGAMQALRAEYETRILALGDIRLFALSDHFVYLTNEFGFDVDGYFMKDDVRWTDADLKGLTDRLRQRDIHVVIHHWNPAEPIRKAIAEGGAKLVVLDDGDSQSGASRDPQSYQSLLRSDLEALCSALGD